MKRRKTPKLKWCLNILNRTREFHPHRIQNLSSQTCILTVVLVEEELLTKSEWDIGLPTQPVYLMNSQYSGFSDEDAFRSHHTQEMHYALNLLGFSASKIISSRVLLMNKSYTLMTFNISKDLKSKFDALTEIHQVTKTSVLIEFIETYCQKQEFKNVKF